MADGDTRVIGSKNLGSSGILYNERRDFYIRPNVVKELWTDVTPFTTVVANQATMSGLADPSFKMFEHRNPWVKQKFNLKTAIANGSMPGKDVASSDIAIDGAEGIQIGSNLIGLEIEVYSNAHAPKFRAIITDYKSSGDKINIKLLEAKGSLAIVATDYAMVIGSAFGEGTNSPEAWSDDLSVVFNQCQIFKTPVEVTGTLLQASLRGESKELARLRDMKSQEHKIQKERAFLFGQNYSGLSGFSDAEAIHDKSGNTVRTTMGIIPAIKSAGLSGDEKNYYSSSDVETYSKFVDVMERVFQYVPETGLKRAFVGAGALGHWSKMGSTSGTFAGDSGWTVNLGDMKRDALGFNYRVLETPHGALQLIPTPSLRGPYNKTMLIVSDENLFHAQYRKPQFQASIQANDYDGVKDQYMSDEGIGISLVESHFLMEV